MNPKRRFIDDFRPERRAEDQETADQTDEDGRTVACIGETKIEPAMVAFFAQVQKARKGITLATAWTTPEQTRPIRGYGRIGVLARCFTQSFASYGGIRK